MKAFLVLSFLGFLLSHASAFAETCSLKPSDMRLILKEAELKCTCETQNTHAQYMKCFRSYVKQLKEMGSISTACFNKVLAAGQNSTCGHPSSAVVCCKTNRAGVKSCQIAKSAEACKPVINGLAFLGKTNSCADACEMGSPVPTPTPIPTPVPTPTPSPIPTPETGECKPFNSIKESLVVRNLDLSPTNPGASGILTATATNGSAVLWKESIFGAFKLSILDQNGNKILADKTIPGGPKDFITSFSSLPDGYAYLLKRDLTAPSCDPWNTNCFSNALDLVKLSPQGNVIYQKQLLGGCLYGQSGCILSGSDHALTGLFGDKILVRNGKIAVLIHIARNLGSSGRHQGSAFWSYDSTTGNKLENEPHWDFTLYTHVGNTQIAQNSTRIEVQFQDDAFHLWPSISRKDPLNTQYSTKHNFIFPTFMALSLHPVKQEESAGLVAIDSGFWHGYTTDDGDPNGAKNMALVFVDNRRNINYEKKWITRDTQDIGFANLAKFGDSMLAIFNRGIVAPSTHARRIGLSGDLLGQEEVLPIKATILSVITYPNGDVGWIHSDSAASGIVTKLSRLRACQ